MQIRINKDGSFVATAARAVSETGERKALRDKVSNAHADVKIAKALDTDRKKLEKVRDKLASTKTRQMNHTAKVHLLESLTSERDLLVSRMRGNKEKLHIRTSTTVEKAKATLAKAVARFEKKTGLKAPKAAGTEKGAKEVASHNEKARATRAVLNAKTRLAKLRETKSLAKDPAMKAKVQKQIVEQQALIKKLQGEEKTAGTGKAAPVKKVATKKATAKPLSAKKEEELRKLKNDIRRYKRGIKELSAKHKRHPNITLFQNYLARAERKLAEFK